MTHQPFDAGQVQARTSFWQRLGYRWHHWSWWYTMPVARCLHRWTYWTQGPNRCPWWIRRWLGGLNVACWTHVCGHGLRYSFDTGCIYWFPRYAKRRLRLP